ncbi:MAG: DUF4249 domain-containing protein [Cyclobacteriaceae bacterium]
MKTYLYLLIALTLISIACEERIDWDVEKSEAKLVVEGRITSERIRHSVKLTETSDYFSSALPVGVTGASVSIADGSREYILEEEENGIYRMADSVAGEVGKTYTLNINLSRKIGGESNFTASSLLSPVMQIDSIGLEEVEDVFFGSDDTYTALVFSGQEFPQLRNSYFVEISHNSTMITDSVQNFVYFNDELVEDDYFEEIEIWEFNREIEIGDNISVKFLSVEENYASFLDAILSEIDGADPLGFNGPAANVKGNISNEAIGYFYASEVSSASMIVEEWE